MGILIKDVYAYTPGKQINNHYFEQILDTTDEWITKRTGIHTRYFSENSATEMAVSCGQALVQKHPDLAISLVIVASFTDTNRMPSASASVANACRLFGNVRVLDINAACSGFVAAVDLADALLTEQEYGLIIGSEQISQFLDMTDRGTAILFGDGAGGILVQKNSSSQSPTFNLTEDQNYLSVNKQNKIQMNGKEVFKFAVTSLKKSIKEMIDQSGMPDYIVCHQANERILDHVSHALELDTKKFYKNVAEIGNTSSASIPLCLNKMKLENCFQTKSKILLAGFGAGLTYYSKYVEIEINDEFQ